MRVGQVCGSPPGWQGRQPGRLDWQQARKCSMHACQANPVIASPGCSPIPLMPTQAPPKAHKAVALAAASACVSDDLGAAHAGVELAEVLLQDDVAHIGRQVAHKQGCAVCRGWKGRRGQAGRWAGQMEQRGLVLVSRKEARRSAALIGPGALNQGCRANFVCCSQSGMGRACGEAAAEAAAAGRCRPAAGRSSQACECQQPSQAAQQGSQLHCTALPWLCWPAAHLHPPAAPCPRHRPPS